MSTDLDAGGHTVGPPTYVIKDTGIFYFFIVCPYTSVPHGPKMAVIYMYHTCSRRVIPLNSPLLSDPFVRKAS